MAGKVHGREARPASPLWNLAKTLAQTAIFWTVFLLVLPTLIYSCETALGLGDWRFAGDVWRGAGVALFVLGGTLGLVSGSVMALQGLGTPLPMDCPRQLVVAGPYRYVRNPMAIAGIGQGVAVGLFLGSPAVIAYALAGGPVWNYFVRPWEEVDLAERFGESYQRYRSAVVCWLPRCRPYRLESAAEIRADRDLPHAEGKQP